MGTYSLPLVPSPFANKRDDNLHLRGKAQTLSGIIG
jgi:hypothetical protein